MKLHHWRPRRDNDAHLIPLINIVFLLLIFFMLTARLIQPYPFEVNPPTSASVDPAEVQELVVLVAADGRLAVGDRPVDEAGLRQLVNERLFGHQERPITLKADADLEAQRLIRVMEVLREAGIQKIILLTARAEI